MIYNRMPEESLIYSENDLKYPYKFTERSFNYHKFDLNDYPDEMKEVLKLVKEFF